MTSRKLLASAVIVGVLALQGIAVLRLTPGPVEKPPFLWPFVDYPMYDRTHYEGDTIPRQRLHGVLADSTEVRIEPSDIGFDLWWLRRGLVSSMVGEDTSDVLGYARRYAERTGRSLAAFRLYHHPLVLREAGGEPAPPVLVKEFRLDPPVEP